MGPVEVRFPAAVLFADVSRYTSLVDQLVQRGPQGLEQIPGALEASYTRCVEQICDLGGEVVQFAGDSLTAYWPADDGDFRPAAAAAAAAARGICAIGAGAQATATTGLHVGVGVGSLWAATLNSDRRFSVAIAGEAVREAALAHARARRWQFALSPGASAALGAPGPVSAGTAGLIVPDATDVHHAWMRRFLPSEVLRAASAEAELRRVTAVFASIRGLDVEQESALARHQALFELLDGTMQEEDGPAGQLVFDDKGLVYTAVFGGVGHFHRDDAVRSVRAARRLEARVRELGCTAAIGVGTGHAVFKVVGGPRRREALIIGAPLIRAARLMTAAEEGVLCDGATRRAADAQVEFVTAGSLGLSGVGDVEATFRPLGERQSREREARLIGRDAELRELASAFAHASDGRRRLVVISGEPGIGKTRLVEAFAAEMRAGGGAAVVARAERGDRRTSFSPWRRVLVELLDLPPESDGAPLLRALRERLAGDQAVAHLPLLNEALRFAADETDVTRHLEGVHRADATLRFFADVLARVAASPIVIALEDSQWFDSASWRLLEAVLSRLPRLLVVLGVRAGEVPEELHALRLRAGALLEVSAPAGEASGTPWLTTLELHELDEESTRALVAATLGDAPVDATLMSFVAGLAGGNPLFAEEIALTLKSQGMIAEREGTWRPLRPLAGLRHFEAVEGVIHERVDRIEPDAQRVLRAAAVVGRSFSVDALVSILDDVLDRAAIEAALERLRAAHLVRLEGAGGDAFQFRHDQTRDVVHASIAPELRSAMQAKLATWLESTLGGHGASDVAGLVQRFEEAGQGRKAIEYAERAAVQALRAGAFREAEAFMRVCLKNAPPVTADGARLEAVRHQRLLGEAHYGLGDVAAQNTSVLRALALAGHRVPTSRLLLVARTASSAVRLFVQQLLGARRRRAADEGARSWALEKARCFSQAAVGDYFEQRIFACLLHTLANVIFAERAGASSDLSRAYAQLGCSLRIAGLARIASHFERRADAVAREVADPAVHAYGIMLEALSYIGYGQWKAVEERLSRSQELALGAGDQITWCNAQAVRFWSRHYRGDHPDAERAAAALLARAQKSGNLQQELWALRCQAVCALSSDRPREACDLLRVMTTSIGISTDLAEVISAKGYLALALTRTGAHGEGIRVAGEALVLLRRMSDPTVHSVLGGLSALVEVLLRGRQAGLSSAYPEWGEWERIALGALDRYRRRFPIGAPRFALWAGVADWLGGRHVQAEVHWRRGLAVARALSLRQDETLLTAELRRYDLGT